MPSAGVISVILKGDMRGLEAALQRSQKRLDDTARKMKSAGASMTAGLTLPLGLVGGAAIKAASTFDQEMTKIETLVGVARDQVDGWRKDVLKLGPALGRGPTELGRALFVVTSAGERGANALKIVESAGKAAASGLGDTADIARAVTAAMQAYSAQGLTAERATDILLKTVREGNLEASELASTLGRVIGVASAMGVEFEEVGGFIATFTRLGVQSAEAVTALRSFMSAMLKPSKDARNTLESLGTSVEEVRAKIRDDGLAEALLFLMDATQGSDDALAAIIPNVRALSGVLGTAKAQPEALKAIMASLKDETLALGPAFDRTRETTAQTLGEFKAQAEALAISLGDQLAPAFSRILDNIKPLLDRLVRLAEWFSKLPPAVQTVTVAVAGLLAVLGPVMFMVGSIISAVGALIPVVTTAAKVLVGAGAAIAGVTVPAWALVAAIAAAAAGIVLLISRFTPWKRELREVTDRYEELIEARKEEAKLDREREQAAHKAAADPIIWIELNRQKYEELRFQLNWLTDNMDKIREKAKAGIPEFVDKWNTYEDHWQRAAAALQELNEQGGAAVPIPDMPTLATVTPTILEPVDQEAYLESWRERVDKELGFMELLQQAGADMLQERKDYLSQEMQALRDQGHGQSELAMDLEQDWLDTHQAIMEKAAERFRLEKQLEEDRRAFMVQSGQLSKEERLRQIDEELAAVKAGSQEELDLQREKFQLAQQLVRGQISNVRNYASATKEATIAALQALLDKLGELAEEFPEIRAMIEDAMDQAERQVVKDAYDLSGDMKRAGVEVGRSFVGGIIQGAEDMGAILKRVMVRIAESFIVKAFELSLGIASPSKVAMSWGDDIGQGLSDGLLKAVPKIRASMAQLRAAVLYGVDLQGLAPPGTRALALPAVSTLGLAGAARPLSEPVELGSATEGLRDYITSLRPSDPVLAARTPEFQRAIGETFLELEANGWRITRGVRR